MLPELLNKLANRYHASRKLTLIVFITSLSGLIATSVFASGPSDLIVIVQMILVGALAQSFFFLGLLYGFKYLHSEQATIPFWKVGCRIGEWANAIILSCLLPLPVVGVPIMLLMFILEKS